MGVAGAGVYMQRTNEQVESLHRVKQEGGSTGAGAYAVDEWASGKSAAV